MHDLRFYHRDKRVTVAELASLSGGIVQGDADVEIVTVGSFDGAEAGAVCFFEGKRPEQASQISPDASACFLRQDAAEHLPGSVTGIVVDWPRMAFSKAAIEFLKQRTLEAPGDDLGEPRIAATARIGSNAVIGQGVEIGERTIIGPNAVIGPGVRIGSDCQIAPGVVMECALIGNGVVIKANSVIGGTGFGVVATPDGIIHAPHFGRTIIQDHVSIGSCCCVDRGVFDDTVIGERTRLDNLVQVAHNVEIGRNCTVAAFGGISGSNKVGDGVQFGGRVGTADHISIGDGARLAAYSGLMRDVPAGETWGGSPAKPLRTMLREMTWLAKQTASRNKSSKD